MSEAPKPLQHANVDRKDDATLRSEAHAQLARSPQLQLIGELLTKLRSASLPWWTPEQLRSTWSAVARLQWFEQRADLRQQTTTGLVGLAPKAARRLSPELQASLIDTALEAGDIVPHQFDGAFAPADLVVYGPIQAFWKKFRERMPWDRDIAVHQELIGWAIGALLADRSGIFEGLGRHPILTPFDVRTAIDDRVWHTHVPVEVRVAIDQTRFQREKINPRDPFHARDDLAIARPDIIASSVPLAVLVPVFDVAEKAMGLAPAAPEISAPDPHDAPTATHAAFEDEINGPPRVGRSPLKVPQSVTPEGVERPWEAAAAAIQNDAGWSEPAPAAPPAIITNRPIAIDGTKRTEEEQHGPGTTPYPSAQAVKVPPETLLDQSAIAMPAPVVAPPFIPAPPPPGPVPDMAQGEAPGGAPRATQRNIEALVAAAKAQRPKR